MEEYLTNLLLPSYGVAFAMQLALRLGLRFFVGGAMRGHKK